MVTTREQERCALVLLQTESLKRWFNFCLFRYREHGEQPQYLWLDQKICKIINLLVFFNVNDILSLYNNVEDHRFVHSENAKVQSHLCIILTLLSFIFYLMLLSGYKMLHESSKYEDKRQNDSELENDQSISNNHQQRIWTTIL